ncbi:MAG: pyridoxal-phosphate dependent enzyme [Candidatus Micrarchaeota archaeon]
MRTITAETITKAHERIAPFVRRTPLIELGKSAIHLKLENTHLGVHAFKIRGVWNRLKDEKAEHIVAAAIGSHGFAVGFVCKALGKKSTCFMPETAPEEKKEKMRRMVDEVIIFGKEFSETEQAAADYAKATGVPFIHPYNDEQIIAGQGTIGLEIACVNDLTDVFVPVGGGGLLAGVASYLKEEVPVVRIYGVQPAVMHSMATSVENGIITKSEHAQSLAEPLGINPNPDTMTFEYIQRYIDGFILPREDQIRAAMCMIHMQTGHIVEGAGAIAVAAALIVRNKQRIANGRSVCIVSGGNISEEKFAIEMSRVNPERMLI